MTVLWSRNLLLKPLLTTFGLLPILPHLFHIPSISEATLPDFVNVPSISDDHVKQEF
jgi:hypothetical protein